MTVFNDRAGSPDEFYDFVEHDFVWPHADQEFAGDLNAGILEFAARFDETISPS